MNRVIFAPDYFPDPAIGRPIANGNIYVGIVDLDPTIEANRKEVSVQEEDGTIVPISVASQPIRTSSGGEPIYNGSIVTILTDGNYSLAITDKNDVQKFYMASEPGFKNNFTSVDNMLDLIGLTGQEDGNKANVGGYFTASPQSSFPGGGVFVWQENLDKSDANGGTIIDPDNVGGFDGTVSTRDAFINAQGGGVGLGCWVRQYSGAVNIRWFGATTDTTDSKTAIQAALDFGAGGSIYVPAGSYYVFSALLVDTAGTSLFGDGSGSSLLVADTGDFTLLTFSNGLTTPSLGRCNFRNIGLQLKNGVVPTTGVGVHFINCQQLKSSDIEILRFFGGMLLDGGGINLITDTVISIGANFTGLMVGSYGFKSVAFDLGTGSYKNPAGVIVTGFDIFNGNGTGYLENAIVIEACDGLWFANGHCGFSGASCVLAKPSITGATDVWIIGLNFTQVHFDGLSGVSTNCVKYEVPVGFTGSVARHSYTGCHAGNASGSCYLIEGSIIRDVSISGGRVNLYNNAGWGIELTDTSTVSIVGVVLDSTGTTNASGGILLNGSKFSMITATCSEMPVGLQLTGVATRNDIRLNLESCTVDVDTTGLTNFDNNIVGVSNKTDAVASASDISIDHTHSVASITGTTTIDTINIDSALLWRKVTLRFASVCIVTDGTIKLAGAFTSTAGSTLTLMYDGANWAEVARAIV